MASRKGSAAEDGGHGTLGQRCQILGLDFGCCGGTGCGLDSIPLGMFHGSMNPAPGHSVAPLMAAHDDAVDSAQVGAM